MDTGELIVSPPKSRTGLRTVALPHRRHLGNFTGAEPDALIFTGKRDSILRRANFPRALQVGRDRDELCVPNLHFHDL